MTRDDLQIEVLDWVEATFGADTCFIHERAARLLEEAIELAQAAGVSEEHALATVRHIFQKPPGDPAQELGGVGLTLLACAAALGESASEAEQKEWKRVLSIPADYFRERHNKKADAGIATRGTLAEAAAGPDATPFRGRET
jgi:NTP pyrophosphatase (non-canonical NTP hydrolase)